MAAGGAAGTHDEGAATAASAACAVKEVTEATGTTGAAAASGALATVAAACGGGTADAASRRGSWWHRRFLTVFLVGVTVGIFPGNPAFFEDLVAKVLVTCGQNSQLGGPSKATYGLFPTPTR